MPRRRSSIAVQRRTAPFGSTTADTLMWRTGRCTLPAFAQGYVDDDERRSNSDTVRPRRNGQCSKSLSQGHSGEGYCRFSRRATTADSAWISPGPDIREPPYLPSSRCVPSDQYSACGERCKAVSNTPASGYDRGVWIETRRLTREPLFHHRILVRGRRRLDRRRSGPKILLRFRRDTRRGGCRVAHGHGGLAGGSPRSRASNSPGPLPAAS